MLKPHVALVGTPRSTIFRRAEANAAGFPVDRALVSSARYSRSRCTAGSKNLLNGSKKSIRDRTLEKTLNSASWCLRCINSCATTFFFQAEDGIRDLTVTGVQTCALPI